METQVYTCRWWYDRISLPNNFNFDDSFLKEKKKNGRKARRSRGEICTCGFHPFLEDDCRPVDDRWLHRMPFDWSSFASRLWVVGVRELYEENGKEQRWEDWTLWVVERVDDEDRVELNSIGTREEKTSRRSPCRSVRPLRSTNAAAEINDVKWFSSRRKPNRPNWSTEARRRFLFRRSMGNLTWKQFPFRNTTWWNKQWSSAFRWRPSSSSNSKWCSPRSSSAIRSYSALNMDWRMFLESPTVKRSFLLTRKIFSRVTMWICSWR